ncbi:MAG: ABC transporter ATP-binding protein, partial [Acetobacteraceae bacterium]|nr:ABC transporter ATP-binding protein [Acetobacteraceae bacterium]
MAGSLVLRVVRAGLPIATLFVAKLIIDEVVRMGTHPAAKAPWVDVLESRLGLLLLAELALALVADALGRAVTLVDSLLSDRFSDETSLTLMQHAATLDLADFEDSDIQDGLDRARRQASGRTGLISQLFGLAQDGITLAGFAAGIAAYAPWLILLLAAALVPAFLGELRFNAESYALSAFRTAERRELDYLRQTGASTGTAKEVKLFSLHGFLIERYRTVSETIRRENAAFARRRATAGAGLAAVGTIGYYAAYGYLAWRTATGALSVGDLTFLAASFLRLRGLLAGILSGGSTLASQALYLQDLFDFLAVKPSITSPATGVPFPPSVRTGLEFRDVGFRYPGASGWAVRHLSFVVPAGEVVALVGENGAGKTTLVKLMTRLYDPAEGRILLDGIDLRDYDLDGLRAGIGVIFQDFVRYDLTAADNIAVGRVALRDDRARVEWAAKLGRADEVVARLERGYDQIVGRRFKGGVELSGGEWQKVAIARAYMRDAALLILDEPTAALDARAEFEVFERFKGLSDGRTAVLISHRFSSVRMADRIVVIEGGRVLEEGTHSALLERGARYAELFELQAAGYR